MQAWLRQQRDEQGLMDDFFTVFLAPPGPHRPSLLHRKYVKRASRASTRGEGFLILLSLRKGHPQQRERLEFYRRLHSLSLGSYGPSTAASECTVPRQHVQRQRDRHLCHARPGSIKTGRGLHRAVHALRSLSNQTGFEVMRAMSERHFQHQSGSNDSTACLPCEQLRFSRRDGRVRRVHRGAVPA